MCNGPFRQHDPHESAIRLADAVCAGGVGAKPERRLFRAVTGNALTIGTTARRIYRQQRGLSRPHELSWDDDSLTACGEDGQSTTRWSEFHKTREVDDLFILFLSDAAFLTIPKRAFPDEPTRDAFRARMLREVRLR